MDERKEDIPSKNMSAEGCFKRHGMYVGGVLCWGRYGGGRVV